MGAERKGSAGRFDRGGLDRLLVRAAEPEFLDPVADLVAREPKELPRARLIAPRSLQRLGKEVALEPLQVEAAGGQREYARRRRLLVEVEEIVAPQEIAFAEEHGALDHVLELPDVSGPVVRLEVGERAFGEPAHVLSERRRERPEEGVGQGPNVFRALPQRRHPNEDRAQPVVEIGPERAFAHGLLQVAVRRRDDPDLDPDVGRSADPLERLLLEESQELDLESRRRFADFVEIHRPPLRELEEALLLLLGVRERAALVTEEFAFQERFRQCGARHVLERPRGTRTVEMDRLGDQVLAGAALADQENRRHGKGCDLREKGLHPAHHRGAADQVLPREGLRTGSARKIRAAHFSTIRRGAAHGKSFFPAGEIIPDRFPECLTEPEREPRDTRMTRMDGEPGLWEDRLAHATVLVEVGELDDGEVEVSSVLEARPDDLGALDLLGKIKHIRGQLSAAVACWAQVQARSPQSGAAHLRLASLLALAKDPERGAGEFLAVGRDQLWRKPAAHLELEEAFRLFAARRPDEARAACDRVAAKYRGADAELYKIAVLARAWIAELTGDLDEARRVLEGLGSERGFESDLDRATALSRVYERLGTAEHLGAAVHIATFLDRHEERIVNVGRLALLFRALGRDDDAREAEARFLDVFRRRMHRPSPREIVRVASESYVPLDTIVALPRPPSTMDEGPARERALGLAWSGRTDEAAGLLSASREPIDSKYRADLARMEDDRESAADLYLRALAGDPGDRHVIVRLLDGFASSPDVVRYFADPARAEHAVAILRSAIHDFPLRPVFWRALGALHRLRGDRTEGDRCAAKAEALAAAAGRRRSALGRSLAASVYHFVATAKGLIHEIWAQRKPSPAGRGGHLDEIIGNLTPEMAQAVRNTFLSVREYAMAKFPEQTTALFDFSYTYKVTKEDEPSGGLSAGLPTALAFLSVFLDRPLPQDVASSGILIADAHDVQIVRPVGEPEYKVRGAYNRNLRMLLLPEGNREELTRTAQVPRAIVEELVRFVSDLDQAAALVFGEDLWM